MVINMYDYENGRSVSYSSSSRPVQIIHQKSLEGKTPAVEPLSIPSQIESVVGGLWLWGGAQVDHLEQYSPGCVQWHPGIQHTWEKVQ